jgi:hypothetical protein
MPGIIAILILACIWLWAFATGARTKSVFLDRDGKEILELNYDACTSFSEGLAAVKVHHGDSSLWGYADKEGQMIIPPRFELAGHFVKGMAPVKTDGSDGGFWGFVDKLGNFAISPQFNLADGFADGFAAVQLNKGRDGLGLQPVSMSDSDLNGIWGFINGRGVLTITPQFLEVSHFSEGIAAVRSGVKWGYIDRMGQWIIPAKFDTAGHFSEGRALVGIQSGQNTMADGYIGKSGDYVIEPQVNIVTASHFSENLCATTVARAWYERLNPFF